MQKNDANTKFYLHILNFIRTFVPDFKNEVFSMKKEFIKVTLIGCKKSVVVSGILEAFYRSQGATIEEPTREEVLSAFPELDKVKNKPSANHGAISIKEEMDRLIAENKRLVSQLKEMESLVNTLRAGKTRKGGRTSTKNK